MLAFVSWEALCLIILVFLVLQHQHRGHSSNVMLNVTTSLLLTLSSLCPRKVSLSFDVHISVHHHSLPVRTSHLIVMVDPVNL